MAGKVDSGGGSLADINVTPLVDVMLVLLVIFMVTAPMMSSTKSKVQLPAVETGQNLEEKDRFLTLVVALNGTISIKDCEGCKTMTVETIPATLKENPKVKNTGQVFLHADRRLKYRVVLKVMAALHQAGALYVGLVTDPAGQSIQTRSKGK